MALETQEQFCFTELFFMTIYETGGSSYFELSNSIFILPFSSSVKLIFPVKQSFHLFPHSPKEFYLALI